MDLYGQPDDLAPGQQAKTTRKSPAVSSFLHGLPASSLFSPRGLHGAQGRGPVSPAMPGSCKTRRDGWPRTSRASPHILPTPGYRRTSRPASLFLPRGGPARNAVWTRGQGRIRPSTALVRGGCSPAYHPLRPHISRQQSCMQQLALGCSSTQGPFHSVEPGFLGHVENLVLPLGAFSISLARSSLVSAPSALLASLVRGLYPRLPLGLECK